MDWPEIVGIVLGGGGFGKMLYDVVRSRSDARKVDADSASVLVTTANSAAAAWQADLDKVRKRTAEQDDEIDALRREQRRQVQLIDAHVRWDRQLVETVRELGGAITDPPPLYAEEAP